MPLNLFGEKGRHVIAIAASKGGVGKSTLTVNLALALKSLGHKVGIFDADLYGPSLRTMLALEEMPGQRGEKFIPAKSNGIEIISLAYFKKKDQASVMRAPIANRLITQFLTQVEWGELDYLLIDFPPGTGDIQITLCQNALLSGALIVTTPQEIALQDVRQCITMFLQMHIPVMGIVENMSYYQSGGEKIYLFGKDGGEKLKLETGLPLLGQIPLHPLIGECLDQGKSLFQYPEEVLKGCFLKVAQALNVTKKSLSIEALEVQESNLSIRWTDGREQSISLYQLQAKCPCAACQAKKAPVDEKVRAGAIQNVGRYAIKIEFTSGCSHGIYALDLLREL